MNEHLQKAQEARKQKKQWALDNLQLDYPDDMQVWKDLAKKYNVRLPQYFTHNSETKYIRRLSKKLNFDIKEYLDYCGFKNLKSLVGANPTWTILAEIGLVLEWWDEKQNKNR